MSNADSEINSVATRTALAIARSLTNFEDNRIPEIMPDNDMHLLRECIETLEHVAAEYAARAHMEPGLDTKTAAWAMLIHTHAAGDLARIAMAHSQSITGDGRPAFVTAEAVLLATLTWRMATGSSRELMSQLQTNTVMHLAGQLTGEHAKAGDAEAAKDLLIRARNFALADPAADVHELHGLVGSVANELGRDAYAVGVSMLSIGDVERARRALTFAYMNGIQQAANLVPNPVGGLYDPEHRIDFVANTDEWRLRADLANRTARFLPAGGEHSTTDPQAEGPVELPCIEVAGVQSYLYLDGRAGRVKVSLHLDTVEDWVTDTNGDVPVEVSLNGNVRVIVQEGTLRVLHDDDIVYER